ncbi:copper-binding protein [Rhodocyclus tenuis]|uniref:copper-binding protein n=1 Tax=Rhodocyclus tenuis TaxID=1066 RepID=UPI001908AE59|nr:copper-binding protein [Rhodocyclus tenuis]MBK1678847.1 hypothetical protein [Rhodocyclus tenuis]
MKNLTLASFVTLAALGISAQLAAAETSRHGEHDSMHSQSPADAQMTDGLVRKVDKAAGTVTIAHGPLNGMTGMTMAFRVKESAWLEQLKAGQKIRFAADEVKGALTVVRLESAQ